MEGTGWVASLTQSFDLMQRRMAQIVVVETDIQPATDGKLQPMEDAFRFGTFKNEALLVIPSGWAAITASQMWNNGSLHRKEQI